MMVKIKFSPIILGLMLFVLVSLIFWLNKKSEVGVYYLNYIINKEVFLDEKTSSFYRNLISRKPSVKHNGLYINLSSRRKIKIDGVIYQISGNSLILINSWGTKKWECQGVEKMFDDYFEKKM